MRAFEQPSLAQLYTPHYIREETAMCGKTLSMTDYIARLQAEHESNAPVTLDEVREARRLRREQEQAQRDEIGAQRRELHLVEQERINDASARLRDTHPREGKHKP